MAHIIAVRDTSKARGPARCIMYALASRADIHGSCFPSIRCLAKDAGLSVSTVADHLPDLVELGELSIQHGTPSDSTHKASPNRYQITLRSVPPHGTPPYRRAVHKYPLRGDAFSEAYDSSRNLRKFHPGVFPE